MSRVPRSTVNTGLIKALINRLEKLELKPGDQIVVTFPAKVYTSEVMLQDAQRFAQSVADMTKHEVVIVAEGVDIYVRTPSLATARVSGPIL